ncbi:hypothetical protein [Prauserella flavalba]|uniref:hypothetical protein n=1 Tax=Prauserella flavalba TaxID=1477506 RepID=UPI0036F13283
MRRFLGAIIAANVLAAVLVLLIPTEVGEVTAAATPTPPTPCDWDAEWSATIAELGEDPLNFVRQTGDMDGLKGRAYLDTGVVTISTATTCEMVSSVIRHEWVHLQQGRMHGGLRGAWRVYGDRLEIVADCGSWLLGSQHTPYRQRALEAGQPGCSPRDLAEARRLITFSADD